MSKTEERRKEDQEPLKLGLKDYVALSIAALESVLLPLLILIVVLLAMTILITHL